MPQPQATMLAPCSVPQTLPLRAANQQGRSMGTTRTGFFDLDIAYHSKREA